MGWLWKLAEVVAGVQKLVEAVSGFVRPKPPEAPSQPLTHAHAERQAAAARNAGPQKRPPSSRYD